MTGSSFRRRVLLPVSIAGIAVFAVTASVALEQAPRSTATPKAQVANKTSAFRFRNVTRRAGVADIARTWGTAWTDFEGDGDPDVFVGRHWREPRILLAGGLSFQEMTVPRDLEGTSMDRHACVWGEANYDGQPDLLCTQGADNGQGEGPNQLLINRGDTLRDKARKFRITYARGRGRTVNWVDYDNDGDLDVFLGTTERPGFPMQLFKRGRRDFKRARVGLSHELSVLSSSWADWDKDGDFDLLVTQHYPFPTYAFENVRGKRFESVSLRTITGEKWISASWDDFNGDGWTDLQMVGRNRLRIFRNVKGHLRPVYRTRLRQGRSGTWFDVDNDGDLDSFVVQGAAGNNPNDEAVNWRDFLVVRERGRFRRVEGDSFRGPRTGNGEVATAADFDRDGLVDILVTNGLHHWMGPTRLLRNRSVAGNWAGLDLEGSRKNPLGYGAIVRWKLTKRMLRKQLSDGVTFKGQSEVGYVHLGLGNADSADVKIKWPDGTVDCTTIPAGIKLTIEKGSLDCP